MPAINLFAVQLDIAWEDRAANFRRASALLEATPPAAGSLVILPEMFASGFSMNLAVTRQSPAREDEAFLAGLARKHQVFVMGGVVSGGAGRMGRNEAVAFSPDGALLARYAKIHPFSLGGEAPMRASASRCSRRPSKRKSSRRGGAIFPRCGMPTGAEDGRSARQRLH